MFGYITFPVPRSLTKGFLLLVLFLVSCWNRAQTVFVRQFLLENGLGA